MKGGMTDVQFCSAAFCIIDFMGGFKAPDRETERRTQKKQKEITFQNGADGNIMELMETSALIFSPNAKKSPRFMEEYTLLAKEKNYAEEHCKGFC